MSGSMKRRRISTAMAPAGVARTKISTTVASETLEFLDRKVRSGEASSRAEALDAAIARIRKLENRQRLAAATAAYFGGMTQSTADAENSLAADLASASLGVDYDKEL